MQHVIFHRGKKCISLYFMKQISHQKCFKSTSVISEILCIVPCLQARSQNYEKWLLASSFLSVCPYGTIRLPLEGFSWKSFQRIQVSLKCDQNNGHCAWRPAYIAEIHTHSWQYGAHALRAGYKRVQKRTVGLCKNLLLFCCNSGCTNVSQRYVVQYSTYIACPVTRRALENRGVWNDVSCLGPKRTKI